MSPNTQAPHKHTLAEWMRNPVKSRWVRPPDVEEALPRLPAWPITAIVSILSVLSCSWTSNK